MCIRDRSDANKRRAYDAHGHAAFEHGMGGGGGGGGQAGYADINDIFGDIFGNIFGGGAGARGPRPVSYTHLMRWTNRPARSA